MHVYDSYMRRGASLWKVLGIIFLVLVLICGGFLTWAFFNFRTWLANATQSIVVTQVDMSNLSDDQKTRIKSTMGALIKDFKEEKASFAQVDTILKELLNGPFMSIVLIEVIESDYYNKVKPDESEKAEVALTFDRFERGIFENLISNDKLSEILTPVSAETGKGNRQAQQQLTAEDHRAFVDAMKAAADEAGIPNEPYQVDLASELDRIITEVRTGAPPTTQPATSQPSPATSPAAAG